MSREGGLDSRTGCSRICRGLLTCAGVKVTSTLVPGWRATSHQSSSTTVATPAEVNQLFNPRGTYLHMRCRLRRPFIQKSQYEVQTKASSVENASLPTLQRQTSSP